MLTKGTNMIAAQRGEKPRRLRIRPLGYRIKAAATAKSSQCQIEDISIIILISVIIETSQPIQA
jgi:hypothetical protein